MNLTLNRKTTNDLYTEGQLLIKGKKIAHTVEHTLSMLPAGLYQIRLRKIKTRGRIIGITHTPWSIGIAHSWMGSQKNQVIAIGRPLIPGAVYRATRTYERLFERIEKCQIRKEPIKLLIHDNHCVSSKPAKHWQP